MQVAPFVANGAQARFLSVFHHGDGLRQACLVVDIERNEHVVLQKQIAHFGIVPNGHFHLSAVDTTVASEINQHGASRFAGIGHAGVVVGEFGFNLHRVEVEVLCAHWRSEGADRLAGSAPKSRHHVDGERERAEGNEEARHAHVVFVFVIVRKFDFAQEVETEKGEDGNPEGEERFAVEQVPAVCQVGHGEEFQGEGEFKETQCHLHHIEPTAALGRTLEPCREEGEEGERQRQCEGETKHADSGGKGRTATGADFNEQETDDGACA